MSVTHLASPADHRAHASRLATQYNELSMHGVQQGDWSTAVATQWASDMHRVLAALWGKAAVATDPETTFFTVASQVAVAAFATPVAPAGGKEYVEAARSRWTAALGGLNVPLVFTPLAHLQGAPVVDWQAARDARLSGWEPAAFVQARREQAATLSGLSAALAAAEAFLIDQAIHAGDELLVTVTAGMALVGAAVRVESSTEDAVEAVKEALGPVVAVRATPYLPAA